MRRLIPAGVVCAGLVCGCADTGGILARVPGPRDLPFIHKIDVQQGNVITQEMLAQLQPGMDRKKVQFVMGTAVIQDTFNAQRWDYLYTFKPGGQDAERRLITLVFVDDKLDHVEGDVIPAEGRLVADLHQDTTINVPRYRPPTLATKIKNTLPFVEPTENEEAATDPDADKEDVTVGLAAANAEPVRKETPYDNIQAAPGEGVVVPPDAPTLQKKKGFFAGLVDSIGLGPEDDEQAQSFDPGDPKYRDITDPNQR